MSVSRYMSATERMMNELTDGAKRHRELFGPGLRPGTASAALQEAMDSVSGISAVAGGRSATDELLKRGGKLSALEKAAAGISDKSLVSQIASGIVPDVYENSAARQARRLALEGHNVPATSAADVVSVRTNSLPAAQPRKAPAQAIKCAADIGPLIRDTRKSMDMTQSDFAAHAGVGRRFLSELESGKPTLEFDKVMACAEAAGIDLFARPRSTK